MINCVALKFFAGTPSNIRFIVKICDVVDRFLRKPFRFFPRIFPISGSMQLSRKALYVLATLWSKDYISVVLVYSVVTFLAEREDAAFCPSIYYVLAIYRVAVSEQYVVKFPFFHTSVGISSSPAAFLSMQTKRSSYTLNKSATFPY